MNFKLINDQVKNIGEYNRCLVFGNIVVKVFANPHKDHTLGGDIVKIKQEVVDQDTNVVIMEGFDATSHGLLGGVVSLATGISFDENISNLKQEPPSLIFKYITEDVMQTKGPMVKTALNWDHPLLSTSLDIWPGVGFAMKIYDNKKNPGELKLVHSGFTMGSQKTYHKKEQKVDALDGQLSNALSAEEDRVFILAENQMLIIMSDFLDEIIQKPDIIGELNKIMQDKKIKNKDRAIVKYLRKEISKYNTTDDNTIIIIRQNYENLKDRDSVRSNTQRKPDLDSEKKKM